MIYCETEIHGNGKRCKYCGATFRTRGRVFAECQRIDLSIDPTTVKKPTNRRECSGCKKRRAQLNKLIPGAGDAVAKVAEPIANLINHFNEEEPR